MFAHEAVHAAGRIEQMQRDRVRHDLAHQAHHVVFELGLELRVPVHKGDPARHRQLGDASLGDANDGVGRGRVQPPRRVAGLDVALVGKAQDHLVRFGVGDDALQQAVEHEVLLHLVHTLVQQVLALRAIDDLEAVFQLAPLLVGHRLKHHVLFELNANDVSFGMQGQRGHRFEAPVAES
jgi:hypothetical protein